MPQVITAAINVSAAMIFAGVDTAMKIRERKEQQLPLPLVRELPATPENLIFFGKAYRDLLRQKPAKRASCVRLLK